MPCLSDEPENHSNFLRWRRCNGVQLPLARAGLGFCNDLAPIAAVLYNYRKEDIATFLPVVNGDVLRFFVNSPDPKAYGDVDELHVGLIRRGVAYETGFASTVQAYRETPDAQRYRLYGTLAVERLPDGVYNPYLYLSDDPTQPLYIANGLRVCNYSRWERETVVAKFRHSGALAGVPFPALADNFFQQFRIPFALHQPKYSESEEKYTDKNNVTRTTEYSIARTFDLTSDIVDAETFEAGVLMLTHDEIYLDGKPMRRNSNFEVVEYYNEANALTVRGRVEDSNFATALVSC